MTVTKQSRVFDAVSVGLVLIGVACYLWAYIQMEVLRQSTHDPKAMIFAGYVRFVRLVQLSRFGMGLIAVGVMVGIGAAVHARRIQKQSPS
jgi:hypothetical protein